MKIRILWDKGIKLKAPKECQGVLVKNPTEFSVIDDGKEIARIWEPYEYSVEGMNYISGYSVEFFSGHARVVYQQWEVYIE